MPALTISIPSLPFRTMTLAAPAAEPPIVLPNALSLSRIPSWAKRSMDNPSTVLLLPVKARPLAPAPAPAPFNSIRGSPV